MNKKQPRELFLEDSEGHLKALIASLTRQQYPEVMRLLHTLRGNAQAFGFSSLSQYLQPFEQTIKHLQEGGLELRQELLIELLQGVKHMKEVMIACRTNPEQVMSFQRRGRWYLIVKTKGQDIAVLCEKILKVIATPRILWVAALQERTSRMPWVCYGGELYPVLAMQDDAYFSLNPVRQDKFWVVLLTQDALGKEFRSSLIVDEIVEIRHFPFGLSETFVKLNQVPLSFQEAA